MEKGTFYLDGNELVGPFVFKTDGYWMLLDARQWQGQAMRSWTDLVLGDSIGFVPPDSGLKTARPNDVIVIMDRTTTRNEFAGMPDDERLERTIRLARDYGNVVTGAAVVKRQGVVAFQGHREQYVFEIGSMAKDSAQAVALGIPRLERRELIKANAEGLVHDLADGPVFKGIGYLYPSQGRSAKWVRAQADSLRRGYDRAWPAAYEWAREDVKSPRPLERRMKALNPAFAKPLTPSGYK